MATSDEAAIRAAVFDYFEGWFDGDAVRMERALHPRLAKRALAGSAPGSGEADPTDVDLLDEDTAGTMIDATARGVGTTRLPADGDPRIEIQVEDVYDTIASVTVRSAVYHEYLHLVRTASGWKIANALWQHTLPVGDRA